MSLTDLNDVIVAENGKTLARGDAAAIDEMLSRKLDEVSCDASGWITIYRHRDTGQLWELSYPKGECRAAVRAAFAC